MTAARERFPSRATRSQSMGGSMRKYLILFTTALTISTSAYAREDTAPDGGDASWGGGCCELSARSIDDIAITVTATGTRSEVEDTGQSVTVIGQAEIDAVQGADV